MLRGLDRRCGGEDRESTLQIIRLGGPVAGSRQITELLGKPSRPVLRGPGGRKAAWLLGSNANIADGGIRKGTRSDETRPIVRPWPLPPLRPKRAASGLAGSSLREWRAQDKPCSNIGTSAGKLQPEAVPLNI